MCQRVLGFTGQSSLQGPDQRFQGFWDPGCLDGHGGSVLSKLHVHEQELPALSRGRSAVLIMIMTQHNVG